MPDLTAYRARWVLPVTSAPFEDGVVVVDRSGRIAAVGPADATAVPAGAARVDLGEAALLPGLVNAHTHLELSFLRGLLDDLSFTDWIPALLAVRSKAGLDPSDYEAAARWSLVEALAAGITTVGATEDSVGGMHALIESGQRGVIFREVFGPDPEQCEGAAERFAQRVTAMRESETDLVRVGISPHAPFTVSDPLFQAMVRLARDLGMPLAIHTAESRAEMDLVSAGRGVFAERLRARAIDVRPRARSTIALLDRLGVLEAQPLLIHCVHVDPADIARIAAAGAPVAHCPTANARLGHGIAPVEALLAAGVTVGLGTDSVASNNRVDLLEEGRTAQLLQRGFGRSPDSLPSGQLLRMATLEGARALGIADQVGSLEVGKDADLCAVSLAGAHVRPVHDPLAALFHAARATDVVLTVVRGRVLYRNGRHTSMDTDAARTAMDALAVRARGAFRAVTDPASRPPRT